ncbi:hypothetical protein [Lutimonas sp.]|uniref:hypothetical protein n=1 Tax=Lutimonas sp. TaxID=1872403 RepID=UPI003C727FB5
MKKITLILTVVAVITLNFKIYAQEEVPKELLLSSLNSVAHLKLENDQITQLMDYNKGFVDEVYEILESDKEEKYKKKSMNILAEKRENDLRQLIGKRETNKYLKLMEDELKPLGRKNNLLKSIIKN